MIKQYRNILLLLFGIFIIIYVFYIRLILVRAPRDLILFMPIMNWKLLYIILIWVVTSIFILYKSVKLLFNSINTEDNFLNKIILKIQDLIDNALTEVYQFIANSFTNNYDIVAKIAKNFYRIFGKLDERFFIIISQSCKVIIVIVFLVDIFYYFKLNYFYKSLILLCIPICINILIFILKDFANNLEDTKSYLIITIDGYDPMTKEPFVTYSPSKGNEDINLSYHIDQFILCSKISGYFDIYNTALSYYIVRFNIIIYSLYLMGWFYVIYYNIVNY